MWLKLLFECTAVQINRVLLLIIADEVGDISISGAKAVGTLLAHPLNTVTNIDGKLK